MSEPLIVFFDTFTHNGQTQENTDCVRFKSGIQLFEVRILPFGAVVDSNLSDEPLLGATNPANFDVVLYSNSQTNCITLHNIAKHHFDEKSGINKIVFKEPVQSNFLLFRGNYSTLTVVLFGLPTLSLNPSLHHGANLAVPPPQLSVSTPGSCVPVEAVSSNYQKVSTPETALVTTTQKEVDLTQSNSTLSWSQENPPDSCTEKVSQQKEPTSSSVTGTSENSGPNVEEKDEPLKDVSAEAGGLYEDGEIQDIDYEEISSNEELFSEIDEADLIEEGQHATDILSLIEAPSARFQWRFNPWQAISILTTNERQRIPDPCMTLFEMHCWLLDRLERNGARTTTPGNPCTTTLSTQSFQSGQGSQDSQTLLPPPDEWSQAAVSAQFLLEAVEKFTPGSNVMFDEMWVETMENIDAHLAMGLAFLHHTDKAAYDMVNEALVIWVYTGLDMSAALRQSNSTYIVRHLMAGVNLVGLVTGTTTRPLASSLLYPAGLGLSDTVPQLDSSQLALLQVQHRLLNLLESPLITTPLRLAICRALDQTTRLSIGLDAFLGRACATPDPVVRKPDPNDLNSEAGLIKSELKDSAEELKKEHQESEVDEQKKAQENEMRAVVDTPIGDPLLTDFDQADDSKRTPYQRLLFLICSTKNSRVINAYQRLLNKVHAYEMLIEFHQLISDLQSGKKSLIDTDLTSSLIVENQLVYYLNQMAELWRNADELISNPRSTLPTPMVLDTNEKQYHDAYPDLCAQLDATYVLDDIVWLLQLLLTSDLMNQPRVTSKEVTNCDQVTPKMSSTGTPCFILTNTISDALVDFIRLLMAHSIGLTFLASRSELCARLLDLCLNYPVKQSAAFDYPCQTNEHDLTRFLVLGLELAYKLEALRCIDILVAWARKKGVTGVYSTIAQLRAEFHESRDTETPGNAIEPSLRDALFRLACLPCSGFGASYSSLPTDWADFIGPVVTCSAPVWVADVIGMDDHFVPLLMLLEALNDNESVALTKSSLATVKSSESLREIGELEKNADITTATPPNTEQATGTACDAPAVGGIRATLRQLLANPLDVPSLVTTIVLNLLRHGENVTYLDRYGPRMAMLVSLHNWEDHLSDPVALTMFSRLRSFNRSAAAHFLAWLRECPARPSNGLNLLYQTPTTPLSSSAFAWLISQLKPLTSELEEALDALIGMETADDLLVPLTTNVPTGANVNSGSRKVPHNQGVVHGRCLPSALLVLLRLIRMHVCGMPSPRWNSAQPLSTHLEHQVAMNHTLALIELYSANGLQMLMTLVQKIVEHFLIQCQATLRQSTCSSDLLGISLFNTNISMLLALLENAIHLIVTLLFTILHVRGDQFSDLSPVRTLCLAYTCATYAMGPPGIKTDQLVRIRDCAIAGITAYMGVNSPCSVKVEELEKSMWTGACKEVIAFTLTAPMYYLSGVKILLDLLPLHLPVTSLGPLSEMEKNRIRAMRDAWAVHIWSFVGQITGLIELLGATDPRSTNPLYGHIVKLVHRVADLGVPCATALATSCLNSLFSVWDEHVAEATKKKVQDKTTGADNTSTEATDKSSSTGPDNRPNADVQPNSLCSRTPGSRLLMLTCSGSSEEPDPLDAALLTDSGKPSGGDSDTCTTRVGPSQSASNQLSEPLIELTDSTEVSSALCLLHINLQVPACRYALLHLLRPGASESEESGSGTHASKSHGDATANTDTVVHNRSYHHRFSQLAHQILSPCSDKPSHIRTQIILLQCLDLMMDSKLALKGFCPQSPWLENDCVQSAPDELTRLSEGLPDLQLCAEIVQSLIKHVGHIDRDMSTLPHALHPLLLLSQHDQGFILVRDALDSPIAQIGGQHLFASLVQRVNDCFSTENPDCKTTLAVCLQLLQSMVVGRASLPLTFSPDETATTDTQEYPSGAEHMEVEGNTPVSTFSLTRFRHLHISGNQVRAFLGWSGVGDEGKPVRDLHALLEMLTDDEPSLEYLRTGMKNLLSLLSEEFDVSDCDPTSDEGASANRGQCSSTDNLPSWPESRSLEQIFSERPYFVVLTKLESSSPKEVDQKRTLIAQYRRHCVADLSKPPVCYSVMPESPDQLTCDLTEMAKTYCNGFSIREELLKCGRKRESAETAIRHQKRRRGQTSIIETGRTSRKFVAPMRGRGFVLRCGPGSSGSAGAGSTAHGSGSNTSGGGAGRPDPFRSRPLNTSRPPSLHVDDFTKLVKDDNVIEEIPRTRSYRDNRGFRGGRGPRISSNRGGANTGGATGSSAGGGGGGGSTVGGAGGQSGPLNPGSSLLPTFSMGLGVQPLTSLNAAAAAAAAAALLPSWSTDNRPLSLLPFGLDSRSGQQRRDRPMR